MKSINSYYNWVLEYILSLYQDLKIAMLGGLSHRHI